MIAIRLTILFFIISLVSSCSQEDTSIDSSVFDKEISSSYERPKPNPEKNVYFGDLHVHEVRLASDDSEQKRQGGGVGVAGRGRGRGRVPDAAGQRP